MKLARGDMRVTWGGRAEILVEGPSKRNPARMMGRTRSNKIVVIEGSERHRGQVMDVKITRAGSFTLYGDPAILNLEVALKRRTFRILIMH